MIYSFLARLLACAGLVAPASSQFVGVTFTGDIVRVDATTATAVLELSTGLDGLNGMTLSPNGRIWCIQRAGATGPQLVEVDTLLGTAFSIGFTYLNTTTALARSPSDTLYTVNIPGTISKLYLLDLDLMPSQPGILIGDIKIGNLFTSVQGMTFAPDGTLYGWANHYGLLSIDPLTAQAIDVDAQVTHTEQILCLAWGADGFLYGGYEYLYRINPSTGVATLLGGPLGFGGIRGMEPFSFAPPTTYCQPKRNSAGCLPAIRVQGDASLSGPDTLQFSASNVLSQKPGLLIWSLTPQQVIFGGGALCVKSPIIRLGAQLSTGSGVCDGGYAQPFTQAYMASRGLQPGDRIHAQWWSRDPGYPVPKNIGLTEGLMIELLP